MIEPPLVRVARDGEAAQVAQVLTAAFGDEAGLNYWLRQGAAKEVARRAFFNAAVRDVVHPGRVLWLAQGDGAACGAAIWLGPGQQAYQFTFWRQLAVAPLLLRIAGVSGAMRGLTLGARLDALHPQALHAHLVFLGVAPSAQGSGVGSAMLKHQLAALDARGTPALLEATSERNVALYARHGFETVENLEIADLHVRVMWRAPR